MQGRSPVVHVSDALRSICVELGYFDPDSTPNQAQLELGCALEHAIIQRLRLDNPGRFTQPGEVIVDGLPGTPDLFDLEDYMCHEIKCTWMSTKWVPGSDKFWKFEVQLMAYTYMLQATSAMLHVCYINGTYPRAGQPKGEGFPYAPVYRVWQYDWTDKELSDNWRMLIMRRDTMEKANG